MMNVVLFSHSVFYLHLFWVLVLVLHLIKKLLEIVFR